MTDDLRKTTRLFLIEAHYESLGDLLEWRAERFRRLAETLNLTVYELGAVIRLTPGDTDRYLKADKFPSTVELHLALIHETLNPNPVDSVFPSLPSEE